MFKLRLVLVLCVFLQPVIHVFCVLHVQFIRYFRLTVADMWCVLDLAALVLLELCQRYACL